MAEPTRITSLDQLKTGDIYETGHGRSRNFFVYLGKEGGTFRTYDVKSGAHINELPLSADPLIIFNIAKALQTDAPLADLTRNQEHMKAAAFLDFDMNYGASDATNSGLRITSISNSDYFKSMAYPIAADGFPGKVEVHPQGFTVESLIRLASGFDTKALFGPPLKEGDGIKGLDEIIKTAIGKLMGYQAEVTIPPEVRGELLDRGIFHSEQAYKEFGGRLTNEAGQSSSYGSLREARFQADVFMMQLEGITEFLTTMQLYDAINRLAESGRGSEVNIPMQRAKEAYLALKRAEIFLGADAGPDLSIAPIFMVRLDRYYHQLKKEKNPEALKDFNISVRNVMKFIEIE